MKTIGLIGGMSWESSLEYYRLINQAVRRRLGGLHSAPCVLVSLDFAEIEILQRENRWEDAAQHLVVAAHRAEAAGAELLLICANTMHKVAGAVEASSTLPLLHIADATAEQVRRSGMATVGLLGTRYTMQEDFYRGRLEKKHGLKVLVPDTADQDEVHRVIFEELVVGRLEGSSRASYRRAMDALASAGAEGIILGCTEISLLVSAPDSPLPLFDTTHIHAEAAVDFAWKNASN